MSRGSDEESRVTGITIRSNYEPKGFMGVWDNDQKQLKAIGITGVWDNDQKQLRAIGIHGCREPPATRTEAALAIGCHPDWLTDSSASPLPLAAMPLR